MNIVKSGFVSIIGRPNVGKSTLLNSLVNAKVAITSDKAQTTRNIIQGIYNEENTQIVFVDTPGIHKPQNRLGKILNKQALSLIHDVDTILFLVDASTDIGKGDLFIIENLKNSNVPVILVLNKIDKMKSEEILKVIDHYKDLYPFADIIPVSALTKDNIDLLVKLIKKYLKDDVKYFEDDVFTSNSTSFMISEIVREKLFSLTVEEVPHCITCVTTSFEEKENVILIDVDIIVERDSIKKIVIGKNGERLKMVGMLARKDIEEMLGKKVYLELYVKTIKRWRDKEKILHELGFNENE